MKIIAKLFSVLFLLTSLFEIAVSANKKYDSLHSRLNSNGLSALTDANFTKYALAKGKPYWTVFLVTASNPQYGCFICADSERQLGVVAAAYRQGQSRLPPEQRNMITFSIVDVDSGRSIFHHLKLQTAPHLYILPPRAKEDGNLRYSDAVHLSKDSPQQAFFAQEMIARIGAKTGIEIKLIKDPTLVFAGAVVLMLVLGLLVHCVLYASPSALLNVFRSKALWMTISFLVYGFGIGGQVSCIIKGTPMYANAGNNRVTIFGHGGRDQLGLEGVFVAFINLMVGLPLVALYGLAKSSTAYGSTGGAPQFDDLFRKTKTSTRSNENGDEMSTNEGATGGSGGSGGRRGGKFFEAFYRCFDWFVLVPIRVLLALTMLSISAYFFIKLIEIYQWKTPWYKMNALLPKEFVEYAGMASKKVKIFKSDNILKRLLRATSYGLYEATSCKMLRRKWKVWILDYLLKKAGISGGSK